MFDRATYTQNRQLIPRNCRRLRPPAKRRAGDSAVSNPIMMASLTQVTGDCGFPRSGRDETVIGRDDLDGRTQTPVAVGASYIRVIQHRHSRRHSMSTFIPSRTAGSRARVALVLLGSLAGVMAAGAAGAATPNGDVPSVVVKFGDLTLDTDSGVNQLYRRIVFAAKQVCHDDDTRHLMVRR